MAQTCHSEVARALAAVTAQRGAVQKRDEARRILASMGLPSPRGATSAVEQEAIRAVGAAEQAMAEARSSGDARAIAEAEEGLRRQQQAQSRHEPSSLAASLTLAPTLSLTLSGGDESDRADGPAARRRTGDRATRYAWLH